MEYRLEVVVLPVSDVDKAKDFYQGLGWRLDADFDRVPDYRVVQLTPPGSACSVIFGTGVSSATPGSAQGLHLVTADIDAARADLAGRGAEVSEVFHDATGVFHHAGTEDRVAGPLPGARELRIVRLVRRPRRQRLAGPGDHHPPAGPVSNAADRSRIMSTAHLPTSSMGTTARRPDARACSRRRWGTSRGRPPCSRSAPGWAAT